MKNQRQSPATETDSNTAVAAPSKRGRPAKVPKFKAAAIEALELINLHAAGIDVGSAQNFGDGVGP